MDTSKATSLRSDALVFFGASGDLAYKKIFPALLAMQRDGFDLPIIGISRSGWNTDQLRDRARDSIAQAAKEQGVDVDEAAFAKLAARLQLCQRRLQRSGDVCGA